MLDTNVILDVLLRREKWLSHAEEIWKASTDGRLESCATASSLTDVYYISRRLTTTATARRAIEACLDRLSILGIGRAVLENALAMQECDFEDAVQMAAAVRYEVDAIVSRDPRGFARSPVPPMTPDELVARLAEDDG